METLDVLKGTRELLSDPAHWVQDVNAVDLVGEVVLPTSPDARSWCMIGAAIKVGGHEGKEVLPSALAEFVPLAFRVGQVALVASFNDAPTTTHADILAALDGAIELL